MAAATHGNMAFADAREARLRLFSARMNKVIQEQLQESTKLVEDLGRRHDAAVNQLLVEQRAIDDALSNLASRMAECPFPPAEVWPAAEPDVVGESSARPPAEGARPAAEGARPPAEASPLPTPRWSAASSSSRLNGRLDAKLREASPVPTPRWSATSCSSRVNERAVERAQKKSEVATPAPNPDLESLPGIPPVTRRRFNTVFMQEGSLFQGPKRLSMFSQEEASRPVAKKGAFNFRAFLRRFLGSPQFFIFNASIIVANIVVIGLETNYLMTHGKTTRELFMTQFCMNIYYVVELVLRVTAHGWNFCAASFKDDKLYILSILFVSLALFDLAAESIKFEGLLYGRILRLVRFLRVLRTVRVLDMIREMRVFRKMLYLIQASAQTLLISIVLFVSVIYLFAVVFCQGLADHLLSHPGESSMEVDRRFGSLWKGMVTLETAMSKGVVWNEIFQTLEHTDWFFCALLIVYIVFMHFNVKNVVAAVFVESAVTAAQNFRDFMVQEKKSQRELWVRHIQQIFTEIDVDGSGEISFQELDNFVQDENLGLRHYFDALEIDASDTRVLFQLLDIDQRGRVDIQGFCSGCMRLKGEASSLDVHSLMYESRRANQKFSEFMRYVEDRFVELQETIYSLDGCTGYTLDSAKATRETLFCAPPSRGRSKDRHPRS